MCVSLCVSPYVYVGAGFHQVKNFNEASRNSSLDFHPHPPHISLHHFRNHLFSSNSIYIPVPVCLPGHRCHGDLSGRLVMTNGLMDVLIFDATSDKANIQLQLSQCVC